MDLYEALMLVKYMDKYGDIGDFSVYMNAYFNGEEDNIRVLIERLKVCDVMCAIASLTETEIENLSNMLEKIYKDNREKLKNVIWLSEE